MTLANMNVKPASGRNRKTDDNGFGFPETSHDTSWLNRQLNMLSKESMDKCCREVFCIP
jgi:hypothetical protein